MSPPNFPYTINVPFASNNPSIDQGRMEQNTNSIYSYVAEDHVPFNTSGSGWHEQVTFAANNVPVTSSPVSPPVLFTNDVGSNPMLFFYSNNTFNQYVNAASGSTYLLGGMILKWGISGTIGSPTSFAVAFPNACYSVVVTGTNPSYTGNFAVTSITSGNFTVVRTSGSGSTGFYYVAIGY